VLTSTTDRAAADASNGSVQLYRGSDSLFQDKVSYCTVESSPSYIGIGSMKLVGVLVS